MVRQYNTAHKISSDAPGLTQRSGELARLASALDTAEASAPTVMLLEGATGIGKTTLLEEAADVARARGFQVASAVTSNLDKFMSFSVVRQLFEELATEAESDALRSIIGAGRGAADRSGAGKRTTAGFDELSVHQTYYELYQLVGGLADRGPVCLIVDDLQWADVSSLRWLNYLVRRATRLPLAVLLSCTTGVYPADPLQIAEMQIYATRVKIGGFSTEELSKFIELMLGRQPEPEFIEACHTATGGNPLVLRYLLTAMREASCGPDADALKTLTSYGPQELGESVLARLNRESSQLVQLARTIAVVEPLDLKLAAEVADMPLPAAADGVRQLAQMGLMTDAEKPAFTHSVIKNAIANSITHAVRDDLHARAAALLHESQAQAAFIARHVQCTTSKLGGWAADALRRTADELLNDGDVITAASFLSRALQEDVPAELRTKLLIKLGRAETYFDTRLATTHFEQALENIEEPELLFDVVSVLSDLLHADGQDESARSALRESIDRICASAPKFSAQLRLVLRVTVPTEKSEQADLVPADFSGDWRRADARGRKLAALVAQDLGNRGEDLATCREAALVALSAGAVSFMQDPRMMAAINQLILVDEFELAMRYATEAIQEARRQKLDLISLLGHTMRSRVHRFRGALERSADEGRLALAEAQQMNLQHDHPGYAWPLDALLPALLHLGDVETASELVDPIGLASPLPATWHHTNLLHRRGHLRLELGDAAGALEDQLECGRRLTSWGATSPAFLPWRAHAVVAHLRLGQSREALNLALEELELAKKWTSASAVARALLSVGVATGGAAALPWLIEAEQVLRDAPALLLRTEVLVELGTARWHHGQQELARNELAQAKDIAQQCGSLPLLAKLAELPPEAVERSDALSALHVPADSPLTPHEHRVAGLVAAGESNDEVARKLSVSRRAVEFHLTNIYRKLGIRRRTQLAAVLHSSGNGG
ncbi:ATP-binding protein [Lentzea flaviverrucosa]|uniref:Regulatory protein, luxR family n=1 Tax=Lentzea flaviverrucosa TaxID=200379 RepID=A0A1H9BIA0_9PSEU|nr:LuxR family transcriptional regulator [Lentzea flaviverrucosa]RDI31762.1 regulatory LuxR family protein [Lentzea flaviverrucosa]SEP88730.1 regulatory protein, luxR family [Lentzea flaviverrucosa]